MTPVRKAVWYVESHFAAPISLEDVAENCGVSPYHLTRAFATVTGLSVMRYVRARRLTEAARILASGAPDILTVALDAGYGSHEAFTRAFRDQFGLTPEEVRARGHFETLDPQEPFAMNDVPSPALEEPHLVTTRKPLLIAGIGQRYSDATRAAMPAQWQRLTPHIGHVPGQVGHTTYGVVCNGDDEGHVDYICGVEVADFGQLPDTFARLRIAPAQYAVFAHREHISTIHSTFCAIWERWLPRSGYRAADAPFFERYDERFNPDTGLGLVEIWMPVERP